MAIIKKRGDELRVGDVFDYCGNTMIVLKFLTEDTLEKMWISDVSAEAVNERPKVLLMTRGAPGFTFDVIVPDLTPAQQHAEELVTILRYSVGTWDLVGEKRIDEMETSVELMRALLDKIEPPEPPTLAEALEALNQVSIYFGKSPRGAPDSLDFHELLDRARRAGLIAQP